MCVVVVAGLLCQEDGARGEETGQWVIARSAVAQRQAVLTHVENGAHLNLQRLNVAVDLRDVKLQVAQV